MKKLIIVLLSALLVACQATTKPEQTTLTMIVPKGAPALAFANAIVDKKAEITLVDGTDLLTTEFAKKTGDYDMVVAPINLGAKLIQDGKTTYKLVGVVTWGNLYIIGNKPLEETDIVTAFGQGAVPDKVMLEVFKALGITNNIEYFPSASEVQAQVLSNQSDIALLAEPAASATIAKAKQNEKQFSILYDLQKEWKNVSGTDGYPQAGLFVREESYQKYKAQIDAFVEDIIKQSQTQLADPSSLSVAIETITPVALGVPSAELAIKTYARQNIRVVKAKEVTEDIATFLKLFNINFEDTFLTK